MESIYAVIFTLILMLPIIVQLQMLIANPKKFLALFRYYSTNDATDKNSAPKLLQHYPKEPGVIKARSDSKMLLTNLRTVSSLPAVPRVLSITKPGSHVDAVLPEARYSSTFLKTDEVLPVVDITWTYSSYRYKAFESCLRDHYGARYPPGEVVLNSMQLHLPDSSTNVGPRSAGLFDFVKESETALNGPEVSRKLEIEYLNPLDHFVTRRLGRPSTEERFTEAPCERADEERRQSIHDAPRRSDPIRDVITRQEKNARINRRSSRKIETPSRCNLSAPRRVYGPNDSQPRRNVPSLENTASLRPRTETRWPAID
ncbi:uncharacterized protein LOC128878569 [Hylaeus volcanicus]|uniref:uncharacterized protein LOC128878569 n=1 Tax=Hylaeus volcanicus TaxID=313075 RepID=UPI0023B7A027|nr:uncharacterized protein LOC128878569 [Hylaeus volcanicus]